MPIHLQNRIVVFALTRCPPYIGSVRNPIMNSAIILISYANVTLTHISKSNLYHIYKLIHFFTVNKDFKRITEKNLSFYFLLTVFNYINLGTNFLFTHFLYVQKTNSLKSL